MVPTKRGSAPAVGRRRANRRVVAVHAGRTWARHVAGRVGNVGHHDTRLHALERVSVGLDHFPNSRARASRTGNLRDTAELAGSRGRRLEGSCAIRVRGGEPRESRGRVARGDRHIRLNPELYPALQIREARHQAGTVVSQAE